MVFGRGGKRIAPYLDGYGRRHFKQSDSSGLYDRHDTFVGMLDKMKVAYSDWPGTPNKVNVRADGMKQVFFQDPDGYWLEVNSVNEK
jgi:hypothetical protein